MKEATKFAGKPPAKSSRPTFADKEKAIPHYLISSTGSCHDLCKYGGKPRDKVSSPPWRSDKATSFGRKPSSLERKSAGEKKAENYKATKVKVDNLSVSRTMKSREVSEIREKVKRVSAKKDYIGSSSPRKKPETAKAIKPSGQTSFSSFETRDKNKSHLSDLRRPISYVNSKSLKRELFPVVRRMDFSLKPTLSAKSMTERKGAMMSAPKIYRKYSADNLMFPRRFRLETTRKTENIEPPKGKTSSVQSSTSSPHSCLSSSSPSELSASSYSASPSLPDQEAEYQDFNSEYESSGTIDSVLDSIGDDISFGERRLGEATKTRFKASQRVLSDRANSEPETVTLRRHQDLRDKSGNVGLFNHVIEETASKLAETRKSKVKALVGAFETVISLQERKSIG